MCRLSVLIFFFCLSFSSFGQLTDQNKIQLKKELSALVNALRKEKGLKALQFHPSLEKAAEMHSKYMAEKGILDHVEKNVEFSTPTKRVLKAGGTDLEAVGENVLYSTPQKFPLDSAAIVVLAKEMFESWKNSPGHYANMINKTYELGDFGFEVNAKHVVYATQVFAKKGIVVKNQLSNNAFGLKQGPKDCAKDLDGFMNLVNQLGNSIEIQGNEVMFYYSDFDQFNRILKGDKDGIAVDIIQRSQVPCSADNQLDMSPFYDGVLLKPLYKKEILSKNQAESNYRLITSLGKVPEHLKGKELNISLVLIKNGNACLYLSPGVVPSENYHLSKVEPKLTNPPDAVFSHEGIIESVEVKYDFRPSDSIPLTYPSFKSNGRAVHSVYIQSFTSIDGDKRANDYYHYMRAQTIKKHIQSKLNVPNEAFTIDARENWELMDFQMLYYFADELASMSRDSIKKHYSDYEGIPWRELFQKQRRSTATINFIGKIPPNAPMKQLAEMNLRTALINKNWNQANRSMYELYQLKQFPHFIIESPYFEIIKSQSELTQNAAALFIMSGKTDDDLVTQFLYASLSRSKDLSFEAKENLALLYAQIAFELLTVWDLPAQSLANVIHPTRIISMVEGNQFRDEVMLNMHLTFINYFGQVNDAKNIRKSFDFISSQFNNVTLPVKEEIDLVLFFNQWSRYDLTIDRLKPLFKNGKLNEEGVFILAKTLSFYHQAADQALLDEVMAKAMAMNKVKWCKWINAEFQQLRNPKLKEQYCKTCK